MPEGKEGELVAVVVDDTQPNVNLICTFLRGYTQNLFVAENIANLREFTLPAVTDRIRGSYTITKILFIVDHSMPGKEQGADFLANFPQEFVNITNAAGAAVQLTLVLHTANDEDEFRGYGFSDKEPPVHFLKKPLHFDELEAIVEPTNAPSA